MKDLTRYKEQIDRKKMTNAIRFITDKGVGTSVLYRQRVTWPKESEISICISLHTDQHWQTSVKNRNGFDWPEYELAELLSREVAA